MTKTPTPGLPLSVPPHLLTKRQAMEFVGLAGHPGKFNRALGALDDFGEPILPAPLVIEGEVLWHREQLGARLDALAGWNVRAIAADIAERRVKQWSR